MTLARTQSGAVRGLAKDGIVQWRGIPYAEAPRFLPPRPVAPWTGERDATTFAPVAIQSRDPRAALMSGITEKTAMDEQCLALNVYSPAADDRRRPVVVWIHGGAFIMGSSSQPLYNGTSFAANHDVVVVTINYRLGLLGFLYLADVVGAPYEQGNVALLDQVAALRWVRANIAAFGGDPQRVTVMGESAGAVSIGTLVGMPAARGLFDRAILQSGASGLAPPTRADATELARGVVAEVGDPTRASIEQLLAAQERVSRARGLAAFTPFVDGVTVPRPPTEAVRDGDGVAVPMLLGSNRDEWALFHTFFGEPATAALRDVLIARLGEPMRRIHDAYRALRGENAWIDILGEVVFRIPTIRLAEAVSRHAPAWMYRFDWASPAFGGRLGAAHALELPFVWNQLELPFSQALLAGAGDEVRALAARMHGTWAAFIRGEDPPWPRYEEDRRATMIYDRDAKVVDDPDGELRRLWTL